VKPPLRIAAAVLHAEVALAGACSCEGADAAGGADTTQSRAMVPPPPPAARPDGPFLKGQLHAHTSGSRDSDTPPEAVVRWYSRRGYDFLVITDHNRITSAPETPAMMVLPGVELTINLRSCEPPPTAGHHCLLHMNALLPERPLAFEPWLPLRSSFRRNDLFAQELDEALRMGAIAQLDHPNFHFAAGADTIATLAARGLLLLEIANESHDAQNEGDAQNASTEALWDAVLTRGGRVLGTATDDAHDYFDDPAEARRFPEAYTGDRGFVMVRAERSAKAIRAALASGDFYATTGLYFERVEMGPERVTVEAAPAAGAVSFEAIGERGDVLRAESGRSFTFEPRAFRSSYVRVRAVDGAGRRAWTQPLFLDAR
jgi:hypothetical protein